MPSCITVDVDLDACRTYMKILPSVCLVGQMWQVRQSSISLTPVQLLSRVLTLSDVQCIAPAIVRFLACWFYFVLSNVLLWLCLARTPGRMLSESQSAQASPIMLCGMIDQRMAQNTRMGFFFFVMGGKCLRGLATDGSLWG